MNVRSGSIGASDAPKLIASPYDLWLEKTGREKEVDLSRIFYVQLGKVTEKLNLDWYEITTGHLVVNRGELMATNKGGAPLTATLDGMDATRQCVIECKHVHPGSSKEAIRGQFAPQCQHQMLVAGVDLAILSVIVGTAEPVLMPIPFDHWWIDDYISLCSRFWKCVVDDTPPQWGKTIESPDNHKRPNVIYRMEETPDAEAWKFNAEEWVLNQEPAARFSKAREALKALVPADAASASGNGITVTRKSNGVLSIRGAK